MDIRRSLAECKSLGEHTAPAHWQGTQPLRGHGSIVILMELSDPLVFEFATFLRHPNDGSGSGRKRWI